jgi:hypothetical protein
MIDQDPSHHLCRDAEKVCAILPGNPLLTDQPEIHLVNQGGRLQRVVPTLVAKIATRSPSELSIDERQEVVTRLEVTPTPGPNKVAGRAGPLSHQLSDLRLTCECVHLIALPPLPVN